MLTSFVGKIGRMETTHDGIVITFIVSEVQNDGSVEAVDPFRLIC